jgi:hypothetical protein
MKLKKPTRTTGVGSWQMKCCKSFDGMSASKAMSTIVDEDP